VGVKKLVQSIETQLKLQIAFIRIHNLHNAVDTIFEQKTTAVLSMVH